MTAQRLFGQPAHAVTGQDICDVRMTGPGQREIAREALAEAAAGRVWGATVAMTHAGSSGPVAVRWEPLPGPEFDVLVITQHASLSSAGAGCVMRPAGSARRSISPRRRAR